MSTAAWAQTLDELEQRIAAQRAALDVGDAPDLASFVPPDDLGPLPPALEQRARALLAESKDVEAELEGALAHIGQDLALVRKLDATTGRAEGARFLDTTL